MTDYLSILSHAVSTLQPNTARSRAQLYQRARNMLLDQIQRDPGRWTQAQAEAEIDGFDAATDRIESEMARRVIGESVEQYRHVSAEAPAARVAAAKGGGSRLAVIGGLGLLAACLVGGVAFYMLQGGTSPSGKAPETSKAKAPETKVATAPKATQKEAARPVANDGELEPGVDGGSSETGLPYYLRRQAVYYRSVYTAGMIVVDRSQRFLYLVQPQARAIRYGIGIGGECDVSPGLYRVQSKVPWPEWLPSASLLKRRSYPAKLAGGPGNPLGAYALYFENKDPGIHGTNAPRSVGQAVTFGCFRLVNDDVVDLEKRVAIGTGVVVLN